MDHNLKKKKRRAITLVVVMIASIVLGLIVDVYIPIWRIGDIDTHTFCPWIYKGRICIFNMLFCIPFIRKWTPAETDPKVGCQRLENDSICGWDVNAV